MPEKTDYGTKKMVYAKRRKETELSRDDWDSETPYKMPLFVLCCSEADLEKNGHASVQKCYCADCRKAFDFPYRFSGSFSKTEFRDAEPACPECGQEFNQFFAIPAQETKEGPDGKHINYNGSWKIPAVFQGRYLFTYRDKTGRLTRLDDNLMLEHTVVFPSGKTFTWENEISQTTDLLKHRIVSYQTKIDGNRREPVGTAKETTDPFQYINPKEALGIERRLNVHNAKVVETQNRTVLSGFDIQNGKDAVFGSLGTDTVMYRIDGYSRSFAGISMASMTKLSKEIMTEKAHLVAESMKETLPHPIYSDLVHNGLNLTAHKKGSDETNMDINIPVMNNHFYMMVRYPAAVELAAEKAELRAVNYEFAEKRKAAEQAGYQAKSATDSARAKFFREEMNIVSEQLAACDDKILNEIRLAGTDTHCYVLKDGRIQKTTNYRSPEQNDHTSPHIQSLKDRLSFFVYGLREGYPVPGDIALKLKNDRTRTTPTQSTKKLKTKFQTDPIATASNLYTLRKWGITNSDYVKQVSDLLAEQSPVVNPAPLRIKGSKVNVGRKYSDFVNAGVLSPLRDRTAMGFIKLYGKTHDTSAMIEQVFDNRDDPEFPRKWKQLVEDIRLYADIDSNPAVQIIRTKDDMTDITQPASEVSHEERKTQLRNYLDNQNEKDGLRNAYRDFAGTYGAHTTEMINMLAREIKTDRKMDEVKRFYDNHGIEQTMDAYGDFLSGYEDPETAISDHKLFSDRTLVIATRNNKPLFERDLKEIHDELAEMAKKTISENEYLTLPESSLALNQTIPVDLSKLPASQWDKKTQVPEDTMGEFSFHVFDNRFDFVRTASDLRNCVAGASYFNDVKAGRTLIACMKNEDNQTCACIELKKHTDPDAGYDWYIKQFQGYRDGVVDHRYSEALVTWAEDHRIDYQRDPDNNVSACLNAEKRYFYGNGDADFHVDEYDPVLNTTIRTSRLETLQRERLEQAIALYGGDMESGPNLPEVPEDLRY